MKHNQTALLVRRSPVVSENERGKGENNRECCRRVESVWGDLGDISPEGPSGPRRREEGKGSAETVLIKTVYQCGTRRAIQKTADERLASRTTRITMIFGAFYPSRITLMKSMG